MGPILVLLPQGFWGTTAVRLPRLLGIGGIAGGSRKRLSLTPLHSMEKTQTIDQYKTHPGDTGSCEVQIALITQRVTELTAHLRDHPKDFHSRRGLIALTSQRRRLLEYLKRKALARYTALIQKLGLKR